jgi:hypothetical protein
VLAVNGYLENGRFTPYDSVTLPLRTDAILVIGDSAQSPEGGNHQAWLEKFHRMAADSASENGVFFDEAFARRPSERDVVVFDDEGAE